jgi:hypothetical protein
LIQICRPLLCRGSLISVTSPTLRWMTAALAPCPAASPIKGIPSPPRPPFLSPLVLPRERAGAPHHPTLSRWPRVHAGRPDRHRRSAILFPSVSSPVPRSSTPFGPRLTSPVPSSSYRTTSTPSPATGAPPSHRTLFSAPPPLVISSANPATPLARLNHHRFPVDSPPGALHLIHR